MILQLDFGGGLSVLEVCFRAVLKGRTGIALGCRLGKIAEAEWLGSAGRLAQLSRPFFY